MDEFEMLYALLDSNYYTYTEYYKNYNFSVTLSLSPKAEEHYHTIFQSERLPEAIYNILDMFIQIGQERYTFNVGIYERLPCIDLPIIQLPVFQLSTLKIEVEILNDRNCVYTSPRLVEKRLKSFRDRFHTTRKQHIKPLR
ncbi:hypothetical protein [uncultured Pontibacter sp.]|uniref:hypothetical protein n=1 Tax=uncultured Pontibacter sp. TaxID=453356 RepID=UPI0026079EC9|nr:hypothetical protein [uncultured Pontibacter sp.]